MIEYYHESRSLEVYHHGKHECHVRPNVTENDQYVQRSLQEVGVTVGPKELAQIQMTKELHKQMETGETDMNAIIDIAAKLTNKQRIRDIEKRMTTQLNMAEIGHSTLKKKKPLALVDAAWEVVCTSIMQEQEHTAFLAGRVHSSGKGPSATQLGEKSKNEQMKRSRAYQEAFKEGRVQIGEEEGDHFIPAKRARHRPENNTGDVQGAEQGVSTSRPALSELNIFNKDNPPLLCFLTGMKIKSCYGCKNKFNEADKNLPMIWSSNFRLSGTG